MAGKKRFAAKLVLLAMVLSAGAGGAYYVTYGGGWPPALAVNQVTAPAANTSEESAASPADLDAVASSWATAGTSQTDEPEINRASARSAGATLTQGESVPVEPAIGRRYQVPAEPSVQLASAESEPTALETHEPTPASEFQQAVGTSEVAELGQPVAESGADFKAVDTASRLPLARGQEPLDGDDIAAQFAAASNSTPDEPAAIAEPNALELPETTPALGAAARRAREAFSNDAEKSSATAAGRRYGGPSALSSTTLPGDRSTIANNSPGLTNPFAGQPTSIPVAPTHSEQSKLSSSLPAESADGPQPQLAIAGDIERQLPADPTRSARATLGSGTKDYRNGGQLQPLESEPSTIGGGTNSYSGGNVDGGAATGINGAAKPGERALEGLQKPALAIQKVAPPEIQVGKPAKFAVQVRNIGGQAADDVVIRDQVPAGTRLVSTSPTAESDGNHLTWQLGKLSVGEERTVEMQLMPMAEGEVGSVATVTHSAQASVKTRCTMPQLAIRMTAPSEVMIGGEQRVKIELRNPGSGDATNVMLFENVPQNVKHAAGPTLEFEIGTLRAGETRELELILTAEKAGRVVNILSARADGNLQVQQQVEFEVIAPGLSVAVNGPERRYLERPATYEVVVENPGTAVAHDVQLVTKLPKGLQFIRANNMGEYDAATHAVYWSLAELPQGESGTVELVAMPIEAGPQTLQVEGRAQQGLADEAQQQILVEGIAAIMFEVHDLEDPIEVGAETGYEIRVVNQGTKAATNVRVAIKLPAGMQVVSAEGETRHNPQPGGIAFEPLPQLAPKADTMFRVKVQGLLAGDQRVIVEVNTDDLDQPIRREESTRVFGDE